MSSRLIRKVISTPGGTNAASLITIYNVPAGKTFVPSMLQWYYTRTTISNGAVYYDSGNLSHLQVGDMKVEFTTDTIRTAVFVSGDVIKTGGNLPANNSNYTYTGGVYLMGEEIDAA